MNDLERIAELEAQVERLERDLAQSQELRREAVAARDVQIAKLRRTREQLEHLRARRVVQMALALSDRSRRIVDGIRRLRATPRRAVRGMRRRDRAAGTHRGAQATPAAPRELAKADLDDQGPRLFRAALLEALAGGSRIAGEPFRVSIVGTAGASHGGGRSADDLEDALQVFGWRVGRPVAGVDGAFALDAADEAVIVVDSAVDIRQLPRRLVAVAWIANGVETWVERGWFDDYDIVLASDAASVEMVRARSAKTATALRGGPTAGSVRDAIVAWANATRYGLQVGVPSRDVADRWGDYHFARGIQRSLERAGHPTRVHFLPEWDSPTAARDDVAVHLFGLREAPTRRGQVNILWQISHPDRATPALYERYDHVFVASDSFAARMAAQVAVPVTPLHQATDPERFRPEPGGPPHELLFVANSRMIHRRIVDDLADTSHDLAIYGANWTPELAEQRFVKGDGIPNTELARYYSAATIVLNDHWSDMLAEGFISNRPYDALACGSFVISDHIAGMEAEFDGAVATYSSRAELEPLIARYLNDPDERRRLAERGRAVVLERHTFDHRVQVLIDVAERLAAARATRIDVPSIVS